MAGRDVMWRDDGRAWTSLRTERQRGVDQRDAGKERGESLPLQTPFARLYLAFPGKLGGRKLLFDNRV